MGFHTFPIERADVLDDPARYRFCSREELIEMLDPDPSDTVADFGSGTGFYTTDVAPFVETIYGIDLQPEMHELHQEQGLSKNAKLITAELSSIPLAEHVLDGAFSIVTHHEYADDETLEEIARIMRSGGRLVTIDWSRDGSGEEGPPLDERYSPSTIAEQLKNAGFTIEEVRQRPETVAVIAVR